MIWYHRPPHGWDGPGELAEQVFAEVMATDAPREIQAKFRDAMKDLVDLSRGVGAGYEEVLALLKDTGWSWDSDTSTMPAGLVSIAKYNDKLARLMMLRKLLAIYGLGAYETQIMEREIAKQFPIPTADPTQQRRVAAEDFIRQHEEHESGRTAPRAGGFRSKSVQDGFLPPRNARSGGGNASTLGGTGSRLI